MRNHRLDAAILFLVIGMSIAAPTIIEFRPVSKPATRAPFNAQEILAQAKRVQKCDPRPSKPIQFVPVERISRRIKTLYEADQADREGKPPFKQQQIEKIIKGDLARRQEMLEYIVREQLQTDADFLGAGFIFQHGNCSDSFLLAHQLAGHAIALSESVVSTGEFKGISRWLYAATFDRYLVNNRLLQRFGTQYRFDGPDCQYVLEPFDPNTTNEERTLYEVGAFDALEAMAAAAKCP
jgi:hypothetical protein